MAVHDEQVRTNEKLVTIYFKVVSY